MVLASLLRWKAKDIILAPDTIELLLILKSRGFPVDQSALNPEFK